MILRIQKRQINTETKQDHNTDSFYDNFDYLNSENVNFQEEKNFTYGCAISAFTSELTKYCKKLSLLKSDNSLYRVIYVDVEYDIYLMSDAGKTIERL